MRNTLLSCTFLLLLFLVDFNKSPEVNSNIQPAPLFLDVKNYIVPIIENEDQEAEYRYTRTLKVYYTDPTTTKIYLSDGSTLESYCSDQTELTIITFKNDTVTAISQKRMSCKILAVINLTTNQVKKLKETKTKEIIISNLVTGNSYKYEIHTDYFQKNLIP
jgi:hypothetical protein